MRFLTPIKVRYSALARLAALLLVVLIVSPFTAPFSVMTGTLEASPSGPADSIHSESMQAPAIVEVAFVHVEPSWSVVSFRTLAPTAVVEFARVNRVLRL